MRSQHTSCRTTSLAGWWSADTQQVTGQAIVTTRVVALLNRIGTQDFSYRGSGLQSIASVAKSAFRLAGSVLRRRLKVLYLVCSRSDAGFLRDLPAYLSQFMGVRVIVHVHGSDVVDLCRRPGLGHLARVLLARCDVIVPSTHLLVPLRELGLRHVHVCENFAEPVAGESQATKFSQPRERRPWRVLWNSNVMASKGFFAVAAAVGALADEGVPVRLVVLGRPIGDEAMDPDACAAALKQVESQSWVERPGLVDRPTAMRLLHEADVVCLPSVYHSECQPLALIEAMCAGRSIVIADTPALRATVGDYPCEVVVEQTPAAIKAALQHLVCGVPQEVTLRAAAERARIRFSALRFDRDMAALLALGQLDDRPCSSAEVLDAHRRSHR